MRPEWPKPEAIPVLTKPNFMTTQIKLQAKVDQLVAEVEKYGDTRFSVCDHYNWDRDFYNYRSEIVSAIRNRGYKCDCVSRHGVLDYTITKQVVLS